MKRLLLSIIILAGCAPTSQFERQAIARAKAEPQTAETYFIGRIEQDRPPTYEQAVYIYAIGVAHERMGDDLEALNNYLGAEALGYEKAERAVIRMQKRVTGVKYEVNQ